MTADTLASALAALQPSCRSPIRQWFNQHFNQLYDEIESIAQPNWVGVAELMAESGILNWKGGKPTARCCRETWRKVVAARRRDRHQAPGATAISARA